MKTYELKKLVNILAGSLQVTIIASKNWTYNHSKKQVMYRPEDANILSEDLVTALLLHESGHIKYSVSPDTLKKRNILEAHFPIVSRCLINLLEDFRIEDRLRRDYPFASDFLPEYSFQTLYMLQEQRRNLEAQKEQKLSSADPDEKAKWIRRFKFMQYCWGIYGEIGGYSEEQLDDDVQQIVDLTIDAAVKARFSKSGQEIADIVSADIYPHIKDWLVMDDAGQAEHPMMMPTATSPGVGPGDDGGFDIDDALDSINHLINPATKKLERILVANKQSKFEGKYRSGPVLNKRRLYQHRLDKFNLFQKRFTKSQKDYAFCLLVDQSGSMIRGKGYDFFSSNANDGYRIKTAASTALLFDRVLAKVNIPHLVKGFNGSHRYYKKFNEQPMPDSVVKAMVAEACNMNDHGSLKEQYLYQYLHNGCNNDAQAVFLAGQDLLKRSEQRKILFVISDGQPANNEYHGGHRDLKAEVQLLEAKGIVVLAIGVAEDQEVSRFYNNYIEVADMDTLPKLLVDQLKKQLKKR